jgi:nicotinate-nucleotide--dimethylbenzimidazole phosphoribosyltransferase
VSADTLANLDEMRSLIAMLPGPDLEAGTVLLSRRQSAGQSLAALGRMADFARWLAQWQGKKTPAVARVRVALFAASHGMGLVRDGDLALERVRRRLEAAVSGNGAINGVCKAVDADLRVYELDLDTSSADTRNGPAMAEAECARAMAYGMMAVEQGFDVLCLGDMSAGADLAAAALGAALFGGTMAQWTASEREAALVAGALAANAGEGDAFEWVRRLGGHDIAALVGAILAARMARTPVILDGPAALAAAAVVWRLDRAAIDHCLLGHAGVHPAEIKLAAVLGLTPILALGLSVGEGVGAGLAVPLLRAACD